jgi:predicted RNA-binding protein with PIN domain
MAVRVDSQPVDARVIAAWKAALKAFDETDLQEFAKKHAHLTAGFRKGKVSLPVVVARIQAMLDQSTELSVDLYALLRNATLSRKLVCVLSEEAIDFSLSSLADAYGRIDVYAAMLLDERESIRKLGFDQIASWNGSEPSDSEQKKAIQELQGLFEKFLDHMQVLRGGASFATKPVVGIGSTLVHKRDTKTKKLITDFRAKRTETNRLRRDLAETVSERDRANTTAQGLKVSFEKATTALDLVTQNFDNLSANFDAHVQEAVCCELDRKLVPWLRPAEALFKAAQANPVDLLQEAEELLQRQASVDQRFGLRSQLVAEAVRCKDVRLRLKEAVKESIQPLAELGSSARKLEKRIAEIEKILHETAFATTRAAQAPPLLIEKLHQAATLDELASVRKGLIAIESIGLLAPPELSAAYALIGDKASRLYVQASLGKTAKVPKPSLKGVPLYALQRQVADGHSCTLLIDGHNVLHKLPTLFGDFYDRGDPGARAQQALIQKIDALCTLHENLTVELWFDSTRAHDETIKSNFNVHYSGGKGANRADDHIVAYLQFMNRRSPQQFRALVTADRDEAAKAEACGALIVSPLEFEVMIS